MLDVKDPYENPKDRIGTDKPTLSLIPPVAKAHMSMAMRNGAEKYGPYNWRQKRIRMMSYLDAAERHLDAFKDGEECARDSGVHHLAHAMACYAIILDAHASGVLIDDRPFPGKVSDVHETLTLQVKNQKAEKDLISMSIHMDEIKDYVNRPLADLDADIDRSYKQPMQQPEEYLPRTPVYDDRKGKSFTREVGN